MMDTAVAGRLFVFSTLRGDYDLVLRVARGVRAWRFASGSGAYRFLTEELGLESVMAASALRLSSHPPLPVRLTLEQWERLRCSPAGPECRPTRLAVRQTPYPRAALISD